jgi:hypothetical protein
MMTLSLNFDHRMIDGAPAARFLQDIKALLEGGLESYLTDEKEPEIETQTPPQQQLTSSFG